MISYLNRHNIDLALLQETHLPQNSQILRRKCLVDHSHASGFTTHARGVLTLINPKTDYTIHPLETDAEGRFAISRVKGRGLDLVEVNCYGPNYDCPEFYNNLASRIRPHGSAPVLWGGDFNLIRNPDLDRSGGPSRTTSREAKALEGIIISEELTDVWRSRNPQTVATLTTRPSTIYTLALTIGL